MTFSDYDPGPVAIAAAIIAVLLFALLLILAGGAQARDPDGRYADSPYAKWFKEQHNKKGSWCCDQADGHEFYGEYQINKDGSVTLNPGSKEERTLPAYMVLETSNPTGHAVWWYLDAQNGEHIDYCFAPGSLG